MIKGVHIFLPMKLTSYPAKTYTFYTRSTAYKKSGAPDRGSLIQQKSMLFTRVAPRIKSQGLPIGGPLFRKKSMLFIHIAPRIKSQGLPIDGPLFSKKSMLFTHVAPHIKSKWLLIGGPLLSKNLYFLHAYHHVQKARGSRLAVPYSAKKCFLHM
jgi:hypothetical protein